MSLDVELKVYRPDKLSFASDLAKLAELTPSKVSASSPLPAPSTVLMSVNISLADWSAVALASIPSNLIWSAFVKLLSVWLATEKSNVPSPSWYVTVIPD